MVIPDSELYSDGANMARELPAQSRFGQITMLLSIGMTDPQVVVLQEKLKAVGFFPASQEVTSYFGVVTQAAVKAFQSAHGISPIGVVGPITRAALNAL